MTTVAWDGETLAADKQSSYQIPVLTTKIAKVKWNGKPALAAGSGPIREFTPFIDALRDGKPVPEVDQDEPTFDVMVINHKKEVILFNGSNFPHQLGKVKYAIGSGGQFALGAMYAGKTATEAVKIACQLDTGSGLGIDSATIK